MVNIILFRHSNGVVHGDIKPSNCFLAHDARVCIGDFGSARTVKDGESLIGMYINRVLIKCIKAA